MTIASTLTAKQYTSTGVNTQFAFPNKIFSASDLAVTITDLSGSTYPFSNFANGVLGLTYSVQGVDVDTGCTVVLSSPFTLNWTIDIRTQTAQTQSTSIKNQGNFLPELHEEAFDRVTREIQDLLRLSYTYGIHGPDTEVTVWPALPGPNTRKGNALMFDPLTGLPTLGVPNTQTITTGLLAPFLNLQQSAAEIAAGVTPTNFAFPVGHVYRYGTNTVPGTTDMTAAINAAVSIAGIQVQLPPDTCFIAGNLNIPVCGSIAGYGWNKSIISCGVGVTKALSITGSPATVYQGFRINGNATVNALGIVLGDGALTSQITIMNVLINGFTGQNAAGMKLDQIVTLHAYNVIIQGCTNDLITGATAGLPTTCHFWGGWLQTAVARGDMPTTPSGCGAFIQSCSSVAFHGTVIEVNSATGIHARTAAGCTIQDLIIDQDCWFEDNWHAHVDTGTKVYDVVVDGTNDTNLVANVLIANSRFSHGTTPTADRKSLNLIKGVASLLNMRCQFGFPFEIVVSTADSVVQCVGDSFGLQTGFISNLVSTKVTSPLYMQVMDLGTGKSVAPTIETLVGQAYSASITPDLSKGNSFAIGVSNVTPFTINAPLFTGQVQIGKRMSVRIQNFSGNNVLGALTWNAIYKLAAWVQPQNNFSHFIEFEWDGTNMNEAHRTTTQVPV